MCSHVIFIIFFESEIENTSVDGFDQHPSSVDRFSENFDLKAGT